MRFTLGTTRALLVALVATALSLPAALAATQPSLAQSRQHYSAAMQALEQRNWDRYTRSRNALDDYPLAIYLDFNYLSRRINRVSPGEVSQFLARSADTPLHNRFLSVYLNRAGQQRRWGDFLQVMPREPNDVVLKCYYFRAQLARGDRQVAWEGARELWVHGRSRPDECDPLFDAWMRVGQLDDDLVWARLLATFDARQKRLMAYVARKGSADLQPWSDLVQRVYARPRDINRVDLPAHKARSADIATHGLSYLARYSPEQALSGWRSMQSRLDFSAQQRARVERTIARRSLFARTDAHREWLHDVLARLGDDTLTGIRLRWALRERDWAALERTLPLLSEQEQQEGVWRYWQAVALEQRGALDEARALQEALATERGYYSFLAADRLGVTYAFNARPLPQPEPLAWGDHPVLERIEELHFHDAQTLAHAEWYKLLQDTPEAGHKAQLARLASDRGWHRMAIDAAARARAWDALDVRFPLAYQNVFDYHAGAQQVPSTELLAISRRESAFFPWARSSVGARGLMQIMPATGRQVAASINTRHSVADLYEIDHNVKLGSTYYRQLLDRFGGNRIFALSAYNAGPHRVDRWRNDGAEQVPVDIWVETIPFHETRNYVQAVLAYNVVFQYLMGEDMQTLLTDAERRATY